MLLVVQCCFAYYVCSVPAGWAANRQPSSTHQLTTTSMTHTLSSASQAHCFVLSLQVLLPLVPEDVEAQLAAAGVGVAAVAAEHAHHSHRQGGGAAGGGSSFAAAGPGQEQQGDGGGVSTSHV